MRIVLFVIFFSLITSLNYTAQAQVDLAKLEKNVNIRAKGLIHNLNTTKDTLVLKSDSLINKLYSVSMAHEREIDMSINKTFVKIPLDQLSKGKHVFVAVQSSMRIVFVVKILREDKDTLLAMANDEELVAKNEKE
ncbi:hypothetical protein ES692_14685 [Psychroserpens burtonensis]|jgi:hypothetical protein|uniref:DUF4138 domain-containing protein n=1 Tax=Psychroserpens burtonensis TaxID=49278 RepID=A0A5C7B3H7_9FLAO|nr:hypothetical protein [Psychroserpens burtonensis]TXE15867.1 hypothetical protein ES692_14685 [Psychroserpens burtonensis]